MGVGKFPRGYPRIRAHPLKYTQKNPEIGNQRRVARPTKHPTPYTYHELTLAGLSKQGELNVDVLGHDACHKLASGLKTGGLTVGV